MTKTNSSVASQIAAKGIDKDTVVQIVNSVVSKIHENDTEVKTALRNELVALHQIIQELRGEISNIKAQSIQDDEIPTATDELDAVVEATEEATGTIMDAAEAIENKLGDIEGEAKDTICEEVVKIFEACSFQDITGQRITKVVTALRSIETKVDQLLTVVNTSFPGVLEEAAAAAATEGDGTEDSQDSLLNGPALPEKKVTQDDIDAILAEFDD